MKHLSHICTGLLCLLFLSGCEGFFGEKTDISFIDAPEFQNRDVAYVPILPVIEGFLEPTDVVAGFDDLMYVVDAGTEEIISFDKSGRELGRFQLPGVTKIVQDRRLEILAIGTFDTIINSTPHTLSTIYRLDLASPMGFGIQNARIKNKIINPFYFKSSFSTADVQVEFTSVDVMGDNRFYVTRTGIRDNPSQIGGPDDAVLVFDANDEYETNIFITTSVGFFSDWFQTPLCVTTYAKPPQSFSVSESDNFFVSMVHPEVPVLTQSIQFLQSEFGSSYQVEFLSNTDSAEADDFLYRLNRFERPVDMTLSGDGTNYLFVVDEAKDSVYQFTTRGLEGAEPPPGSSSNKNVIVSFGGTGEGITQFRDPSAVAYADAILYVADRGNGRLLRYRLTTDFD